MKNLTDKQLWSLRHLALCSMIIPIWLIIGDGNAVLIVISGIGLAAYSIMSDMRSKKGSGIDIMSEKEEQWCKEITEIMDNPTAETKPSGSLKEGPTLETIQGIADALNAKSRGSTRAAVSIVPYRKDGKGEFTGWWRVERPIPQHFPIKKSDRLVTQDGVELKLADTRVVQETLIGFDRWTLLKFEQSLKPVKRTWVWVLVD